MTTTVPIRDADRGVRLKWEPVWRGWRPSLWAYVGPWAGPRGWLWSVGAAMIWQGLGGSVSFHGTIWTEKDHE